MLNISHTNGNQTMKFGQLIEYNKGNIFFQNSFRKLVRDTISRSLFCQKRFISEKQVVFRLIPISLDDAQFGIQ